MTDFTNQPSEIDLARESVRALIQQATSLAITNDMPFSELRGVAFFNSARDATFTSLSTFDIAVKSIGKIPNFTERFGDAGVRIVLQFVYQYFKRADDVKYDDAVLESVWLDFIAEVQEPNWTFRAVGNLRNFASSVFFNRFGRRDYYPRTKRERSQGAWV